MPIARRALLAATAAAPLAAPAAAQGARVLRFVTHANLTSLDPVWTTAWITRNHGYLVYDTLYSIGEDLQPKPQMAEGHVWSDDGLTLTVTLREGLRFHDGEPVRAQDVVASFARWARRDSFGQLAAAALGEVRADGDRRVVFRFTRRFPLILDAMAKVAPMFVMPERIAATDPFTQITEAVGSGPYRFVRAEWVPGSRAVYERNAAYQPRQEAANMLAGGKVANFERIEWRIMPDPATVAAALQSGEVDWWENPTFDLIPLLQRNRQVQVEQVEVFGSVSTMRPNHLQPPFSNPAFRRALLLALSQEDVMTAVAGTDRARWAVPMGFFTPGTPLASDAGMAPLAGPRSLDAARRAIEASGYRGERLVFLHATDIPTLDSACHVMTDLLRRLGVNLDHVSTDWGTVVQRRARRDPVEAGGWSAFVTNISGADGLMPATHSLLRSNGTGAWFGWPDSPGIEQGIQAWFDAPDPAARARLGRDIQAAAFQDLPYYPLGGFRQPYAFRRDITGMVRSAIPVLWNARRA
jgi:peptide/nickel transport system substrate-binding protein